MHNVKKLLNIIMPMPECGAIRHIQGEFLALASWNKLFPLKPYNLFYC